LSSDDPKEDALAYHLILYVLFTRLAPEYHCIKQLILVLMSKRFSVDWILNIYKNVLDRKLGFVGPTFAKMLKDLAKAISNQHDVQIPVNPDALLCFWVLMIGLQHYI